MSSIYTADTDDRCPSELPVDIKLNSFPDAVLVADADTGRIVTVNTTAGDLFGCQPSALVGVHQQDLHPADQEGDYAEAFQRARDNQRVNRLQNGQPLYIETCDGQEIPVEINVQQLETPDGDFILGVFREATEQIDREQQLEATTSRLERLLDALPVPAMALDTNGTVERWNRAAERTFGYAADSVVGEPYPLFIEDDEFDQLFETVVDGEALTGYETTHRTRDGSRVPVELYARPIYENNGFAGSIGAAVDISSRRQRDQHMDILHRVLRHNLRNELDVISSGTQQLTTDTGDRQRAIERIDAASDRLLALCDEATRIRNGLTGERRQSGSVPVTEAIPHLLEAADGKTATVSVVETPESGSISRKGLQAVRQFLDSIATQVDGATVELSVETHDRYVVLALTGPASLLPAGARSLVTTDGETALKHSSGLTVPRAYLLIKSVGGDVLIRPDAETTGVSTLCVELPRTDDVDGPFQGSN